MVGWITSRADSATVSRRPLALSTRPSACRRSDKCLRLFSAMMMAPSTISPKSSAPRLIKLALILPCSIPVAVMSMVIGITMAVIRAARKLPSIRKSTRATSVAPRARLVATVRTVASTSSVRLSTVLARMPGGSARLISLIFASAAAETVRLLPPTSIRAVPRTTSRPFTLALPVLDCAGRHPKRDRLFRGGDRSRHEGTRPPHAVVIGYLHHSPGCAAVLIEHRADKYDLTLNACRNASGRDRYGLSL